MKRILVTVLLFVFLTSNSTAFAAKPSYLQDRLDSKKASIAATLQEKKEIREQKLEELRLRIENKKATRSAKLQLKRQERVRAYYGRLSTRIQAAIDRLTILIERIESRLEKISETDPDVDMSLVQTQLDEAKILLEEAEGELLASESALEDVLASEDPKSSFTIVRDSVKSVKDQLKEVHQILVHVIGDLKGLRVGQNDV